MHTRGIADMILNHHTIGIRGLLTLAFCAACQNAAGQIVYNADSRNVTASSTMILADAGGGDPELFEQDFSDMPDPLFGVFDASRLALLLGPGGNATTSLAVQDSSLVAGTLTASGFVETQVNLIDAAPGSSVDAEASSVYRVGFSYDPGVYYIIRVSGSIAIESPDQGGQTNAEVLFGIGGGLGLDRPTRYERRLFGGATSAEINNRIMLGPGQYEYIFEASSSASATQGNPGQSEASYDVTVEVLARPCNFADLAEPYFQLDLADIQAYVEGYQNSDSIIDYVEPFGVLDLAEIAAFVSAFVDGCP